MKIVQYYSHLNGFERIQYHRPHIWAELVNIVAGVNAFSCRTKISKEASRRGQTLYSPVDLNETFSRLFAQYWWHESRVTNWLTENAMIMEKIVALSPDQQKWEIERHGLEPIHTYNQIDFVKERVAVEVQFGKYPFVAHDLFVKHMSFYIAGIIDVGIEIVPMKSLEREMSSGVPYYERDLFNLMRQGRGIPAVPIVLVGVAP